MSGASSSFRRPGRSTRRALQAGTLEPQTEAHAQYMQRAIERYIPEGSRPARYERRSRSAPRRQETDRSRNRERSPRRSRSPVRSSRYRDTRSRRRSPSMADRSRNRERSPRRSRSPLRSRPFRDTESRRRSPSYERHSRADGSRRYASPGWSTSRWSPRRDAPVRRRSPAYDERSSRRGAAYRTPSPPSRRQRSASPRQAAPRRASPRQTAPRRPSPPRPAIRRAVSPPQTTALRASPHQAPPAAPKKPSPPHGTTGQGPATPAADKPALQQAAPTSDTATPKDVPSHATPANAVPQQQALATPSAPTAPATDDSFVAAGGDEAEDEDQGDDLEESDPDHDSDMENAAFGLDNIGFEYDFAEDSTLVDAGEDSTFVDSASNQPKLGMTADARYKELTEEERTEIFTDIRQRHEASSEYFTLAAPIVALCNDVSRVHAKRLIDDQDSKYEKTPLRIYGSDDSLYFDDILSLYQQTKNPKAAWFTSKIVQILCEIEANHAEEDTLIDTSLSIFLEDHYVAEQLPGDLERVAGGEEPLFGSPLTDLKPSHSRIVFCLNPSDAHWTTAEVLLDQDPPLIQFYNSYSSKSSTSGGGTFKTVKEHLPTILHMAGQRPGSPIRPFDPAVVETRNMEVPRQSDFDIDCGAFCVFYLSMILHRQPLDKYGIPDTNSERETFGRSLRFECALLLLNHARKDTSMWLELALQRDREAMIKIADHPDGELEEQVDAAAEQGFEQPSDAETILFDFEPEYSPPATRQKGEERAPVESASPPTTRQKGKQRAQVEYADAFVDDMDLDDDEYVDEMDLDEEDEDDYRSESSARARARPSQPRKSRRGNGSPAPIRTPPAPAARRAPARPPRAQITAQARPRLRMVPHDLDALDVDALDGLDLEDMDPEGGGQTPTTQIHTYELDQNYDYIQLVVICIRFSSVPDWMRGLRLSGKLDEDTFESEITKIAQRSLKAFMTTTSASRSDLHVIVVVGTIIQTRFMPMAMLDENEDEEEESDNEDADDKVRFRFDCPCGEFHWKLDRPRNNILPSDGITSMLLGPLQHIGEDMKVEPSEVSQLLSGKCKLTCGFEGCRWDTEWKTEVKARRAFTKHLGKKHAEDWLEQHQLNAVIACGCNSSDCLKDYNICEPLVLGAHLKSTYKCGFCPKTFKRAGARTTHMNLRFFKKGNTLHFRQWEEAPPGGWIQCNYNEFGQSFVHDTWGSLDENLRRRLVMTTDLECAWAPGFCDHHETFPDEDSLQEHCDDEHTDHVWPFGAGRESLCLQIFDGKRNLDRHRRRNHKTAAEKMDQWPRRAFDFTRAITSALKTSPSGGQSGDTPKPILLSVGVDGFTCNTDRLKEWLDLENNLDFTLFMTTQNLSTLDPVNFSKVGTFYTGAFDTIELRRALDDRDNAPRKFSDLLTHWDAKQGAKDANKLLRAVRNERH